MNKKKIIALCLAAALIAGIVPFAIRPAGTIVLAAPIVKDGYTLTPTQYGASGVNVLSSFLLITPDDNTLDSVIDMISVDDQPKPEINHVNDNEYIITPKLLLHNSIYIFRLVREGKPDITWAFQTAPKFEIVSSFPANQATNVPVETGIEITFSAGGYAPIKDYFSISPAVKGRFEYHKNTAVFVPEKLEYRTLYAVTLKTGLKLSDTGEILTEDYVFEFETEAESDHQQTQADYPKFSTNYAELPSVEPPTVHLWVSHNQNTPPNIDFSIYKFKKSDDAVDAARKLLNIPYWSMFNTLDNFIDLPKLSEVAAFESRNHFNQNNSTLTLPDKLPPGFYLLHAAIGESYDQMILQINDLPVQVIADNDKAIVWVNDLSTGKPASGADVYDFYDGKQYKTDADGIVIIDRAMNGRVSEHIRVTSTDGKECVWIHESWYNSARNQQDYWSHLQLDRTLFKADDFHSGGSFRTAKTASKLKTLQ